MFWARALPGLCDFAGSGFFLALLGVEGGASGTGVRVSVLLLYRLARPCGYARAPVDCQAAEAFRAVSRVGRALRLEQAKARTLRGASDESYPSF
jgi:hypothetical protein